MELHDDLQSLQKKPTKISNEFDENHNKNIIQCALIQRPPEIPPNLNLTETKQTAAAPDSG